MKALMLGIILLSPIAEAQVLDRIFNRSKSATGLVAKWNCPQESYKSVAQLRSDAEVSISYDQNGNIKLNPDVFKVKTLSGEFIQGALGSIISKERLVVDYSDCLENFKKNVAAAVNQHKSKTCADPSDKICQTSAEDLTKDLEAKIGQSSFFQKTQGSLKIPRFLPGSTTITSQAEAETALDQYCSGNSQDKSIVLSQSIMNSLRNKQYDIKSNWGLECLNRIITDMQSEKKRLEDVLCTEPKASICSQIASNADSFISSLKPIIEKKNTQVDRFEKSAFKPIYGTEEDEELGETYFKNNLSKTPVVCSDFQHSLTADKKFIRVYQLDKTISNNVEELFAKTDPQCGKTFLQNYINTKENMLSSDKNFVEFCRIHKTAYCQSQETKRVLILSNVNKMFNLIYGTMGDRLLTENLQCKIEESTDPLSDIFNKIKDAAETVKCVELKNGEAKIVSSYDGRGITNTGNYTLKKVGDNKFQALLNLDFYAQEGTKVSPEEMMGRVQSCLQEVSPYLKGPGGEQLEIKPLTNSEVSQLALNERPASTRIGIEKAGFRSHSRMYMENLDCPTITHEVLHLFGLCDEYKEKWMGEGRNYDCRIVPNMASVMKNQNEAFEKAVPTTRSCDCNEAPCKTIMSSEDQELKEFYLARSFYDVSDYAYRNKFCSIKYLSSTTYSKLTSDNKKAHILNESDSKVSIEIRQFDEKYPQVSRSVITCDCPEGDSECQTGLEIMRNFPESKEETRYCPSYSYSKDSARGDKTSNGSIDYADGVLKIASKAQWPSLLHPNHFTRIIGGGCNEIGADYSDCAQDAYKNGDCKASEKCKDEKYFLGYKQ